MTMCQIPVADTFALVGGATVSTSSGSLAATWPLVILIVDRDRLFLKLRAAWMRKLIRGLGVDVNESLDADNKGDGLTLRSPKIQDLSHVRVAYRSIIVRSERGDFSFGSPRFLPSSPQKIRMISDHLESRGVELEVVNSNFWARKDMRAD
jgi:hypothetical protein